MVAVSVHSKWKIICKHKSKSLPRTLWWHLRYRAEKWRWEDRQFLIKPLCVVQHSCINALIVKEFCICSEVNTPGISVWNLQDLLLSAFGLSSCDVHQPYHHHHHKNKYDLPHLRSACAVKWLLPKMTLCFLASSPNCRQSFPVRSRQLKHVNHRPEVKTAGWRSRYLTQACSLWSCR